MNDIKRRQSIVSVLEEIAHTSTEEEVTFQELWDTVDCIDGVFDEDHLDPWDVLPDVKQLLIKIYGQYCVMRAKYNFMTALFYNEAQEEESSEEDERKAEPEDAEDEKEDELKERFVKLFEEVIMSGNLEKYLELMKMAGIKVVEVKAGVDGTSDENKKSKR